MKNKTKHATSKLPTSKAKNAYELLTEIRRLILAVPKRYNQRWWLSRERGRFSEHHMDRYPACGTVGCVAGWVRQLKASRDDRNVWATPQIAQEILGLNGWQAKNLFDANAAGLEGKAQTGAHARLGAKHIAEFQFDYAAQLKAKAV